MKTRLYIGLFAILTVVYIGLSFLIPPDKAALKQYHLSVGGARALTASFVIPITIIWLAGLYGSLKMKGYAQLVRKSKEGPAFYYLALGIIVLVITQPLNAVLGSLLAFTARHHTTWAPSLTIIYNYLSLIFMATGLVIIALGAEKLVNLVRIKYSFWYRQIWMLAFIALSSIYSYFIIAQPIHTSLSRRSYFMPNWLILLTIAIPYLFFWYRGFFAASAIFSYQKKVKGSVYKGSLSYLAAGIALVVVSSIAIRFISTASTQISRLSLTPVLFIIYGFLVLLGAGFLLITYGAKKLWMIEEV